MLHVLNGSTATQAGNYSCSSFWTDRATSVKDLLLSSYTVKNNLIATCPPLSTGRTPLKTSVLTVELLHHDKHCQYMPPIKDRPATPSMWKLR